MTFFNMLNAVEAEKAKQKTAIGKPAEFKLPAVGEADAAASTDPEPTASKKKTKKKEIIPEGSEAENVLQPEEPEEEESEE